MVETHCYHQTEHAARQMAITQVGCIHSPIPRLSSVLNQLETNSDQEDFPSPIANRWQELGQINEHSGILVTNPDQFGTELLDKYVEIPQDNERDVPSVEVIETSSKDCEPKLCLENQSLQVHLKDTLIENRNLKLDMKSIKQLVAASYALKRENEALLAEYRDFKQHVLNTKCSDCLKLIYQNKMSMSLASTTGTAQFPKIQHVAGMSKVYLACKESKQCDGSGAYPNKLQSTSALEEIVESRLQVCEKEDIDNDDDDNDDETETEQKDTQSTNGGLEYFKSSCEPSCIDISDEIEAKAAMVQRNLIRNMDIRRQVDRMMSENEQMVKLIVDLRCRMNHRTGEVGSLNCKVVDLERQLFEQIEDFNFALIGMVNNSHAGWKRLEDEDTIQMSASVEPWRPEQQTSKVLWQIGGNSTNGESLNCGTASKSESSDENPPAYPSKSKDDDDHDSPGLAWNVSDGLKGSPTHHKDHVLLSKHYVEDLQAEIVALKRTILEQSHYLQSVDNGSTVAVDGCFVDGEKFSPKFPVEDICCEKQTTEYHHHSKPEDKPLTLFEPNLFDADKYAKITKVDKGRPAEVVNWKEKFTYNGNENGITNHDYQEFDDSLHDGYDGTDGTDEQEQTKDIKKALKGSSEFDKFLTYSSTEPQNVRMYGPNCQVAPAWQLEDEPLFAEADKATFCETKVLFLHNAVVSTNPSPLKRTWSDGDVDAMEFTDKSDVLHPLHFQHIDKHGNVDSCEQYSCSEELCEQEIPQTELNLGKQLNNNVDSVKKHKALLSNLRKTCGLANELQSGEGSGEISADDHLSVGELLLLINSYEQLNNEKKILEEENRILGMEIDELATRLMNAEGTGDGMSLPSISEENYEERLAEMEDRLDVKEEELSELRKALAEKLYGNERLLLGEFRALEEGKEIAEKSGDVKVEDVEDLECGETATSDEKQEVFRGTNSVLSVINNFRSELNIQLNSHQENGYTETRSESTPKLSEKSSLLPYREQVIMNNKDDEHQWAVLHLNGKEHMKTELCELEQDLRQMKTHLTPEISRLEAENERMREEVEKWKRLKHLQVDDAEYVFCVQERLASEVEQLSQKLDSTSSELAARNTAYWQLEDAYRQLECENEQLVSSMSSVGSERKTASTGIDIDVFEELEQKIQLLQMANSNLVDEDSRLGVQLKTEDGKIRVSDDNLNRTVANGEMKDYVLCKCGISKDDPPQILDSTNTRWITENGTTTNSSEVSQEHEMITESFLAEAVPQVYEIRDGDSELLQSQSAAMSQPAVTVDASRNSSEPADARTTASTATDGAADDADRPMVQDLVCVSASTVFYKISS